MEDGMDSSSLAFIWRPPGVIRLTFAKRRYPWSSVEYTGRAPVCRLATPLEQGRAQRPQAPVVPHQP